MLSRSLRSAVCILSLLVATSGNARAQGDPGEKAAKDTATASEAKATKAPAKDATAGDAKAPAGKAAAPGPAPAPETSADTAGTSDAPITPGGYQAQLRGLEQRVNELKERIFRSKARLNLLKETVLHGVIAGSRALILHKNEMGSSFRLIKLIYAVDGAQIYSKTDDSGSLDEKREFEVFNGSIVPGNHTISVQAVFRGHGYGIFSYLKGYKFTVRSSHTFTAGEGRQTAITVKAYEKGNITTELKDRPAVKFEVNLFATSGAKGQGGGK